MFKLGLLAKVIIAIILGVLLGLVLPNWSVRILLIFKAVFGSFFTFIIPLLIVGLIAPGIANLGKSAGKLLLITVVVAYAFTLFAGFFSFLTCELVYPWLLKDMTMKLPTGDLAATITPYFSLDIPPLFGVMSALVFAFTLGFGVSAIPGDRLKLLLDDFKDIINKVIVSVIIPLLPFYIFTIFLEMTKSGNVVGILEVFVKIIVLIFIITIIVLAVQFSVAGIYTKQNPLKLIRNMLPAYATALGTSSSAATIPITYEQTIKNNVDPALAGFVIPLCATISMSGSMLKIVACAIAIMYTSGMPIDIAQFSGFILILAVSMIAAPGVPGGAIMAAVGILGSILGFDANLQGLMIALYIVMDSFGTATNVTSDGAIAVIINKLHKVKVA